MKKLVLIIIMLFIFTAASAGLSSCSRKSKDESKGSKKQGEEKDSKEDEEKEKLDSKEAEKVIEEYARALIMRDNVKIKSLYSKSLVGSTVEFTSKPNPHPIGYKIEKPEERGESFEGKITMFSVFTGQPYFSSDETKCTIIKEKGKYVIDKIQGVKFSEINESNNTLFIKEGGDIEGERIVKINELPIFGVPQGATPDKKFSISHERFGPIALDSEGKKLAVSTTGASTAGTYPAIMIINIEDKNIKILDVYMNETVSEIHWNKDGKLLSVLMSDSRGTNYLYIYDMEKGKKVDDAIKDALNKNKYSVETPYWDSKDELVFNVSGVGSLTPDEKKKIGSYKFDVKNMNLIKY